MTDNVELNTGSGGDVVAADDVGGVKYQRVKLTAGGADAAQYGATNYSYRVAASANEDQQHPKASAGVLYGFTVTNKATSVRYVRLYNLASGATSGSTPWRRYAIPASGGIREEFALGLAFDTGLGFRVTTAEGDSDATAATAGDAYINLEYV